MKQLTFFLLVLGLVMPELQAATYYIDATGGNNSNNGLSPATAWKTMAKVNATSFSPGDFILFKRGEVWNDANLTCSSSGAANNPITYGAYGSGSRPIITGMRQIPNWTNTNAWTNQGNNIWTLTYTAGTTLRRIKIDGVQYLQAAEATATYLNANERWFFNKNTDILSVYSTSNPALAFSSMEGTIPKTALNTDKEHYLHFENLDIQGAFDYCVAVTGSHDIVLRYCTIGKLSNRGVHIHNSWGNPPVSYNVLVDNCIIDADFTFDIPEQPRYRGSFDGVYVIMGSHDVEIKNSAFINWGHAAFVIYQNSGLGDIYNVNVHHNYFTNNDLLYGRAMAVDVTQDGHMSNIEIHHNMVEEQHAPSQINGQDVHFHHNILYETHNAAINLVGWNVGHALAIQAYAGNVKNNIYEHNTIVNSDLSGIGVHGKSTDDDITDCIIRNNIIVNGGRNNPNEPHVGFRVINTNVSAMTFENNLVFSPNSTNVFFNQGTIGNAAMFNGANGTDNNTIVGNFSADPLFVDATNKDFHLTNSSPAVNAGVATNCTEDYDGNAMPVGSAPDLGAFEIQTVLAVELTNWQAILGRNNKVKLSWTTLTEEQNSHFVIERQYNKGDFVAIRRIEGNGTTSTSQHYSHIDNIEDGVYTYRLKAVDFDGDFSYSTLKTVYNRTSLTIGDIYPNPTNDIVAFEAKGNVDVQAVSLRIYDAGAQYITTLQPVLQKTGSGYLLTALVASLPPNTYIVDVYVNGEFVKRQFLLRTE